MTLSNLEPANGVVANNWQEAECAFYSAGFGIAANVAGASLLTGQIWGAAGAGVVAGAFAAAGNLAGCEPNPGPPPGGGNPDLGGWEDGCVEADGPMFLRWRSTFQGDEFIGVLASNVIKVLRTSVTSRPVPADPTQTQWVLAARYVDTAGDIKEVEDTVPTSPFPTKPTIFTEPYEGTNCIEGGSGRDGIGQPTTIPDGDCNWTFTPMDSYIDARGMARILWRVTPNKPECGDEYWYWSGGPNGPEPVNPRGPGGGPSVPTPTGDCCEELISRFDSVDRQLSDQKQRFNDIDSDLVQIMSDLSYIKDLLPNKGDDWDWTDWIDTVSDTLEVLDTLANWLGIGAEEDGNFPGVNYTLSGVCEDADEEGNQPIKTVPIVPTGGLYALIARVDALSILLQYHLGYKTPTCGSSKPAIYGDWRTISFVSDEISPEGKSRLRKRFRYRSSSSVGLSGVVDHWKDFTFTAGAVCVQHKGASWGTPQVWADSIDEGKRVIRHAAAEAGVDPDQVGQWRVSGSNNPRYGLPGTMRVNTSGGYYWITERLDSNNRPPVQTVSPDP